MINLYKDPIVDTTQYGYVYRTTNLLNGKTYIGKHRIKTNEQWRSYMGSGRIITNSLKKYGKNNFRKELIAYASSLNELNIIEQSYIIKEVSDGNGQYNIDNNENGTKVFIKSLGIDDEKILSLYFDDKMSWREIAYSLNIACNPLHNYFTKTYGDTDPRFNTIVQGSNRGALYNRKTTKNIINKTICTYCGKSCALNVIERHEKVCKNDGRRRNSDGDIICENSTCQVVLNKSTAIYCRKHYGEHTNYVVQSKNFTADGVKLGGQIASHNRHHVKKEFYTEFCDLCIDYCKENNLSLTVLKNDIINYKNMGYSAKRIGDIYGVKDNTIKYDY